MTEFHRESDNTGNHRHVQFGTRWIQLQRSLETLAGSTMAGWVVGAEARLEWSEGCVGGEETDNASRQLLQGLWE